MRRSSGSIGVDRAASTEDGQHLLSDEQAEALAKVSACLGDRSTCSSARPARARRPRCTPSNEPGRAEHGKDSVVGLAPSAVAAQVLAEDLGIECENTAKWLHEYDRGRVALHARPARDHRRGDPRRHPDPRPDQPDRGRGRREGAAGRRLGATPVGRRRRGVLAAASRTAGRRRTDRGPPLRQRVGEATPRSTSASDAARSSAPTPSTTASRRARPTR